MRRKSLAEERPDLISQWSPDNDLSPSDVSCGSHKKVIWKCVKGHTWQAIVKNRVLAGSGCPYCEHRAVLKGYNDLQTLFPDVAKNWAPNNRLKPSEVSSRSNTEVLWQCENGHEWKARVADRTDGHGCPYCAGQRVWKGFNDLVTTHPEVAAEWSDKNSFSPDTITYKNRSNVWWNCSKCGNDYQAVVYAKANGRICPFCIAIELKNLRDGHIVQSKIDSDCIYLLPQLATIYYGGKHGLQVKTDSEDLVGLPLTAYIPEIGLAIDVCFSYKEICFKEYICRVHDINYVLLQDNLSELEVVDEIRKAFASAHIYIDSDSKVDLNDIRTSYSRWKQKA